MIRLLLVLLPVFISSQLFGQSANPQVSQNSHRLKYGFGYFGHFKLNQNWGIHADVQFRPDENLKFLFQEVFRAGLIRYLNQQGNLFAVGGFGKLNTYSEGFADYFTENRFFEQLNYMHRHRLYTASFRYRLEQRFVEELKFAENGKVVTDQFHYGNRMRFFHRSSLDLTKNPETKYVFYAGIQDEVFLNFGAPGINRNIFDQNRFLVVFGVYYDKHTRLEVGYVNIFLNPYLRDNATVNSLHVAVVQNLDFSDSD